MSHFMGISIYKLVKEFMEKESGRRGGNMVVIPDIIIGLHFEAELGEYFETT